MPDIGSQIFKKNNKDIRNIKIELKTISNAAKTSGNENLIEKSVCIMK